MGIKVEKINKLMNFKQKKWLKPYIDLGTELRSKAENKFQKNICESINLDFFWKLVDVKKDW